MTAKKTCQYFTVAGLQRPHGGMEKMCAMCSLRDETGNCIQDIIDELGDDVAALVGKAQLEIWKIVMRQKGGDNEQTEPRVKS